MAALGHEVTCYDRSGSDVMTGDVAETGLRWESWTKSEQEGSRMYSAEQRKIAIETFVKFDHSYADT
ncbi:hypothetical protein, partial [Tractidigestivibacter scatoligenes]|uniref:hypothetical protein n=1 Tax=Tractidigestivibacter scatoligenes TaxID=1299998 RepID=UPI002F35C9B2